MPTTNMKTPMSGALLLKGEAEASSTGKMHVDSCPRCGKPGSMVKYYKRVGGHLYGPYLRVQHYTSKSPSGTTRARKCSVSLKKLTPSEGDRILRLLRREKAGAYDDLLSKQPTDVRRNKPR